MISQTPTHRIEPVHQSLAELGIRGERLIQVQQLLVHRRVTERLVAAFGVRSAPVVFDGLTALELLEAESYHIS